jgi:hypothetical protein
MYEPVVIAPAGEVDLQAARALAPQLDQAIAADDPPLMLDLSAVTQVDSKPRSEPSCSPSIASAGEGRTLSVVAPNGSAAAVLLKLTGLRGRFSVFPSRDAALA